MTQMCRGSTTFLELCAPNHYFEHRESRTWRVDDPPGAFSPSSPSLAVASDFDRFSCSVKI